MSAELPEPGIDDYLPILIETLSEHPAMENWQFDTTIFWLFLLALVVRRGGVIVDLAESQNRVKLLPGVMNSIRAVSESIFGLDTHFIHLDSSARPEYIRDLVLDRRKRSLRSFDNDGSKHENHFGLSPANPATSPTDVATRYYSTESVLPLSTNTGPDVPQVDWPDVLVVSGLEDCDSPTQNKLWELVKQSGKDRSDGREMLLVWARREEAAAGVPAWLADHFIVSGDVHADDIEPPPRFHRQELIPQSYLEELSALLLYTHIHPPLTRQLNNLISAASTHPNLSAIMTGRFFTALPRLVRASRLLTGGYTLPHDWRANLARLAHPDQGDTHCFGLGGGMGGVDGWARKAGQEPNLAELGQDGEGWFVELRDVKAIWRTIVRHRIKWRDLSQSIMWNLKTDAAGLVQKEQVSVSRQRKRARRQREEVDRIIDDMIAML